jgi:ABC-type antimicrobial peptide transport system permease subunit
MVTDALPSLAELKQTIGPGTSAWQSRRWWIIGGIVVACVAAGTLAYTRRGSRKLVQYESVLVTRGDLAVTVESTGTLEAVTSFVPDMVVISFLFSASVGVIFGYLPARKASRLNPIEALRHE